MIIGIILRAIFFYFVWQLGRRLWATYVVAPKMKSSSNQQQQSTSSRHSTDVFEADFRVINEQDS